MSIIVCLRLYLKKIVKSSNPLDNPETCVSQRRDEELQVSDFTVGVDYGSAVGVFVSTMVKVFPYWLHNPI